MRRFFVILFICGNSLSLFSQPTNKTLYIGTDQPGAEDPVKSYYYAISIRLSNRISTEFSCLDILEEESTRQSISYLRNAAIVGNEASGRDGMDLLRKATSADYLVKINVIMAGDNASVTLMLLEAKKNKTHFRKTASGKSINDFNPLIDQLIEEMAYLEICPYRGMVNIDAETVREENDRDVIPVDCNGSSQTQAITITVESKETSHWEIEKRGKDSSWGEMNFTWDETRTVIDENPCYPCPSGRLSGRTSNETTTTTGKGDKVEPYSGPKTLLPGESSGDSFNDVRVSIIFNRDGTYMLKVQGAARKISLDIKIKEEIKGACDTEEKNETHSQIVSIPVDVILGPFKGTPFQRQLDESGEQIKDQGDEKLTYKYNFSLKR